MWSDGFHIRGVQLHCHTLFDKFHGKNHAKAIRGADQYARQAHQRARLDVYFLAHDEIVIRLELLQV